MTEISDQKIQSLSVTESLTEKIDHY